MNIHNSFSCTERNCGRIFSLAQLPHLAKGSFSGFELFCCDKCGADMVVAIMPIPGSDNQFAPFTAPVDEATMKELTSGRKLLADVAKEKFLAIAEQLQASGLALQAANFSGGKLFVNGRYRMNCPHCGREFVSGSQDKLMCDDDGTPICRLTRCAHLECDQVMALLLTGLPEAHLRLVILDQQIMTDPDYTDEDRRDHVFNEVAEFIVEVSGFGESVAEAISNNWFADKSWLDKIPPDEELK